MPSRDLRDFMEDLANAFLMLCSLALFVVRDFWRK